MPSYEQIRQRLRPQPRWKNLYLPPVREHQTRQSIFPPSRILALRFRRMPDWQKAFFLIGILDEAERLIPPGIAELHEEAFGSPIFGEDLKDIIGNLREVLTDMIEENPDYQLEGNYTLNMAEDLNTWIYTIDRWIRGLINTPEFSDTRWDRQPIIVAAQHLEEDLVEAADAQIEWLGVRFHNRYELLLDLLQALVITYAVKSVYDYLDPEAIIEANWSEEGWFYGPRGGIRALSTVLNLPNTEILTILAGNDEDIPFSYSYFMGDPAYADLYIPYVWNRLAAKVPIARLANPQES